MKTQVLFSRFSKAPRCQKRSAMTNDCTRVMFISCASAAWWSLLIATSRGHYNLSFWMLALLYQHLLYQIMIRQYRMITITLFSGEFLFLLCVGAQRVTRRGKGAFWCSGVTWERAAKSRMLAQIEFAVFCFCTKTMLIGSKTDVVTVQVGASDWRTLLWQKVPDLNRWNNQPAKKRNLKSRFGEIINACKNKKPQNIALNRLRS